MVLSLQLAARCFRDSRLSPLPLALGVGHTLWRSPVADAEDEGQRVGAANRSAQTRLWVQRF